MPGKKKAGAKRTAKPKVLWSASLLAEVSESLICDCIGGTIAAINPAGRALLAYNGKTSPIGRSTTDYFEQTNGKPIKNLVPFSKGSQPKSLALIDQKGRRTPVAVTVKALGGSGAKAQLLVVACPAVSKTPSKAKTAAKAGSDIALSNFMAQILSAASNGIIALDEKGVVTLANPAAADLLNRDTSAMRGMPVERVFVYGSGHNNAGTPVPIKAQMRDSAYHIDHDVHLARSDGESFEAAYAIVPVTEQRRMVGHVITFRDITARRRSEAEMRLAAVVFDHSPEGVIIADAKGRITRVNPAYRRISGSENINLVGKQLSEVLFGESKSANSILDMLEDSDQTQWEQWCKTDAGRRYAARISVSVVRDHASAVQQYVAIIADVTRRKLDEEKIIYQANYDQLTSLPNRTLFMDRLTRLVLESRRAKTSVGLMFIDLDGFKAINDTFGHDAGDELLKSTARRLEKSVREADTVARLGGDEFTVIMPLIDNFEAAGFVAARIIKYLTEPFDLGGREGRVSASIGISLLPAQASTAAELLHNADVAMYHAKHQGKANYQFFRPELEATVKVKDREI